jgi:hypothetical protein
VNTACLLEAVKTEQVVNKMANKNT